MILFISYCMLILHTREGFTEKDIVEWRLEGGKGGGHIDRGEEY